MPGFTPGLRRESTGVSSDFSFLASEHLAVKRAGITVDASTVDVTNDAGDKILTAGTVMAKISATGKYAAYNNGRSDGRELAEGFLMHEINLRDGDVLVSLLTHGAVIVARTSGLDSGARTDMAGRYFWYE